MFWLWSSLVAVGMAVLGFFLGRWYERTRITQDLLTSRDPTDWSSAHRITRGPGVARFNDDEGSDHYSPTPSKPFPALRENSAAALAPTIKVAGSEAPEPPAKPPKFSVPSGPKPG